MKTIPEIIGYDFKNKDLLKRAMTHKSWAYEQKPPHEHNEKLEFIGDAALDLALAEYLYEVYAQEDEGELSKKRASLVNEDHLAERALKLNLGDYLMLGRGEIMSGGGQKPRLLASAFEALVGALYLDASWEQVRDFVREQFHFNVQNLNGTLSFEKDYKTRLQEKLQSHHRELPVYEVISEEGPSHSKVFTVSVKFRERLLAQGAGRSKKIAEQEAARIALEKITQGEFNDWL